jgi:hypothetical protein
MGPGLAYWLRHCATSRTVPGSIPGGVTGDFFHGSFCQNHVPWGPLSLWKWVPGISPGVKAASAYGWRPTTLVVLNVKKIQGLDLPGTPWAISACCGLDFTFTLHKYEFRTSLWYASSYWTNTKTYQIQSCQNFVHSVYAVCLGMASWLLHMLHNAWWHMDWLFGCRVSK